MKRGWLMLLLLACSAYAQPNKTSKESAPAGKHEAAEDKARTVPGGASLGVKRCHADIERFCKDVKPGDGRLGKCLKANAKKLSKPCNRWLLHGGKAHVDRAFQELDSPASPAPAKP